MDSGNGLKDQHIQNSFFDPSWLQKQANVPKNFVWPEEYLVDANEELQAPLVDLSGFLKGDEEATQQTVELISKACLTHGFFQVINHGVDLSLISEAYNQMDAFFKLSVDRKLSVRKTPGSMWGYSGAHAGRFSSKLPWKETLSFPFHHNNLEPLVTNFFNSSLGEDFQQAGYVRLTNSQRAIRFMPFLFLSLHF